MVPFDRLVRAVDVWAGEHTSVEVVAQIGPHGNYEPRHMRWLRLATPHEFGELVRRAHLLIAHAGMGTFFSAAEKRRPVVLFPRRSALREHTSDHQVHTATWLRGKPGIYVAMTEEELPGAIAAALAGHGAGVEPIPPHAPEPFLQRLREALMT